MTEPEESGRRDAEQVEASPLTASDVGLVVVRGASIRALGYGAGLALSALGSVLLLRYLTVDDFGRYMTVGALVAIVSGVSEAGLSNVGGREIALRASGDARGRLVSDLLGLRLALTTAGVLAATGFAMAVGFDTTLVVGTALMGIGLILVNVQLTMMLPFSRELAMGRLATAELVKQAATVAGIAVLVGVGATLLAFFSVQIVVGIVVLAITPWLVGRASLVWRPTFGREEWATLLRLALPLAISGTIAVLYFRLLVVLSSVISTPYETGLLATSYRIVEMLYGAGAVAASVALPVLSASAHESERLRYMTQRMTEVALLVGCYLALAVFTVADEALVVLGGADYEAAAPVLRTQAFALVPAFLAQVWLMTLIAIGRLTALAIASSLALVLTGTLGVVLIGAEGARGGAVAALAGEIAVALVLLGLLTRARGARSISLLPAWKAVVASIAFLAVVQLADLGSLLELAVGTLAFLALVVGTRAVPSELRDAFVLRRRGT